MKNFSNKLTIFVIVTVIVFGLQAINASEINWKAFSKNLVKALKSDNPGLQQSAMQMVIRYNSQLNVKEAEFDMMRVFRNQKNQAVRQLALTTLSNMDSKWAIGFLKTQIEFEEDPVIKKQLVAITSDSYKKKSAEVDLTTAAEDFNKLQQEVEILSREETLYTYQADADGKLLNGGQHLYILHFGKGQLPPVQSFWSITMYDSETQLQVANPLNRYLINSPMMPDLKMDSDGGFTLYIQHESPGADKESNWLPAPSGPFYLLLRLYWPKQEVIDGTWTPPLIERVK